AGHDANVQLSYLSSAAADELRREMLRLASGARQHPAAGPATLVRPAVPENLLDRRMAELVAPELDPAVAPPESVVKMHLGRLLGALLLSGNTVFAVVAVIIAVTWVSVTGKVFLIIVLLPGLLGFGGFYVRRFAKSLRYSIAGTPDGIRVGFGLLSISNETLPPGRIHCILVRQPLLWRPADWWEIEVNRAGHSSAKGAAGQANTTILPVGNRQDVARVLCLLLPGTVDGPVVERILDALQGTGRTDDGFTTSPPRAALLRPFSWRHNGFAIAPGLLLLRKGFFRRHLVLVPQPRLQSVSLEQGPLLRAMRLARIRLHTVSGPVRADLSAIDRTQAIVFFGAVAESAVLSAKDDTSHRWRSAEGDR
ncbi:MAG: PH domain-containing protein, partial [Microbacteriaceae bacterium]